MTERQVNVTENWQTPDVLDEQRWSDPRQTLHETD
jgi:hypothetical protein